MAFGRLAPFPMRLGGGQPAAAMWLEEIKASLPDALTKEDASIVGAENVALARLFASGTFLGEKLSNNAIPGKSHDLLLSWAQRLGVPFAADSTEDEIRALCVAKYKLSNGCSVSSLNDALTALLGSDFLGVSYFYGSDLDHPPTPTVWDGYADPTYDENDLGQGVWLSQRLHIVVSVSQGVSLTLDDFLYLMNVQLFSLLDVILPAWSGFDWNLGQYQDGFILNDPESLLGFTAL